MVFLRDRCEEGSIVVGEGGSFLFLFIVQTKEKKEGWELTNPHEKKIRNPHKVSTQGGNLWKAGKGRKGWKRTGKGKTKQRKQEQRGGRGKSTRKKKGFMKRGKRKRKGKNRRGARLGAPLGRWKWWRDEFGNARWSLRERFGLRGLQPLSLRPRPRITNVLYSSVTKISSNHTL